MQGVFKKTIGYRDAGFRKQKLRGIFAKGSSVVDF
jgi:hypothetical protein